MLNEKACKSTPKGTWNIIRSQNLRKYYDSALLNANCESFFVEYTMGHKINRTKAAYFRSHPNSLAKIYEKFIPFITIQKEKDISESEDFKRMKADNETLLIEAEKHRVERSELQELKAELEDEKKAEAERMKKIKSEIQIDIFKAMNESIMEFNSSPNSEGKSLNLFDVVKKKLSDEKQE